MLFLVITSLGSCNLLSKIAYREGLHEQSLGQHVRSAATVYIGAAWGCRGASATTRRTTPHLLLWVHQSEFDHYNLSPAPFARPPHRVASWCRWRVVGLNGGDVTRCKTPAESTREGGQCGCGADRPFCQGVRIPGLAYGGLSPRCA